MDARGEDDLYSGLPNFKYHETLDKLQASNKVLRSRVAELEEKVDFLTKENTEYKVKCKSLSTNISSVLKTAKVEIKRKDDRITELNKEVIYLRTRSFKLLGKRRRPTSPNEHNINIKRTKPSGKLSSPLSKRILSSPRRKSLITSRSTPRKNMPTPVNKLPSNKEENETPKEPEKKAKLLVPNINCPTIYSQRMFKKIYNAEPVNKLVGDFGSSLDVVDNIPLSNAAENICQPNVQTVENEELDKTLGNNISLSVEKPQILDLPVPIYTNSPSMKSAIGSINENLVVHNVEKSTNLTAITESPKKHPLTENEVEGNKDITSNSSTFKKPSNIAGKDNDQTELKDSGKEIAIQDSKNLMLSGMNSDVLKEGHSIPEEHKTPLILEKSLCDVSTNVDKCSKPVSRNDHKSPETLSDTFGFKKLSKPHTTVFHPISSKWSSVSQKEDFEKFKPHNLFPPAEDKESSEKSDLFEALFGSPLKWTENSSDEVKETPKLNPPLTAYEDSCSAQIENSNFKKFSVESHRYSKTISNVSIKINEKPCESVAKETSTADSPKQLSDSNNIQVFNGTGKLGQGSSCLFQQIQSHKNDIHKFLPFVNVTRGSEPTNVPVLNVKVDESTSQSPKRTRIFNTPKYNDSILGQFDDTTQLISALARDHSKISPIHTPIKENKSERVLCSPESKSISNKDESSSTKSDTPLLIAASVPVKKPEKRAILLDKPINILQPRKTPRIVSGIKPPPSSSPQKLNEPTSREQIVNSMKGSPNSDGIPPSVGQNPIKPQNIKLSSVSDEVIVRAEAIKMSRKLRLKNTKLKSKMREKEEDNHKNLYDATDSPEKVVDPILQSLKPSNSTKVEPEVVKSNQTFDERGNCPNISGLNLLNSRALKYDSVSLTNNERCSESANLSRTDAVRKEDEVLSMKDDDPVKKILNNSSFDLVEQILKIAKSLETSKTHQSNTRQDSNSTLLHQGVHSPGTGDISVIPKPPEPFRNLNKSDFVPSTKENISIRSRTSSISVAMNRSLSTLDKIASHSDKQECSNLERDNHRQNSLKSDILSLKTNRQRRTKILDFLPPNGLYTKKNMLPEKEEIKLLNGCGTKNGVISRRSSKTSSSPLDRSSRNLSDQRNENTPARSYGSPSISPSARDSSKKAINYSIKTNNAKASHNSNKWNSELIEKLNRDERKETLEAERGIVSFSKKENKTSMRKEHTDDIRQSRMSFSKKDNSSARLKRDDIRSTKNQQGDYPSMLNENSPKVSRRSSNLESLNRSRSPTKKESSPIRIPRIEKEPKRTSNFKRPNNNFARSRENCRFRHSSVERKLIKDQRITSRVRITPVRVIRRSQQESRSHSSHRSHSKDKRHNQNTRSNSTSYCSNENKQSQLDISKQSNPYTIGQDKSVNPKCQSDLSLSKTLSCPPNQEKSLSTSGTSVGLSLPAQLKTTVIRRGSRSISFSSTTSDVVSTVNDSPLLKKTETRMEWLLRPIDFNVSPTPTQSKSAELVNASKGINSPQSCSDSENLLLNTSVSTTEKTPEQTPKKSPNIVIVARRRPAKFGVSEISVQNVKSSES